jgi:hypothetical protein
VFHDHSRIGRKESVFSGTGAQPQEGNTPALYIRQTTQTNGRINPERLPPIFTYMSITQIQVESGVVVVALQDGWTIADVIAFVDEVSTLIRSSNGVRRVLVRVEGQVPHTLRYVVGLLDQEARDWGGKRVEFTPAAV